MGALATGHIGFTLDAASACAGLRWQEFGHGREAVGGGERATRREGAAGRQRQHAGHVAGNGAQAFAGRQQGGRGNAGEQTTRVGVSGFFEQVVDARVLDHAAGIHDRHAVRDLGHHAEVVRDEQDAHVHLGLEPAQQIEDLRLHGHVQRGGGLVGDQHGRVEASASAIMTRWRGAARHLVRVLVDAPFGGRDLHAFQHLASALERIGAGTAFVLQHGLGELVAHRVQRVQAGHGLLEDHGDLGAADAAQRGRRGLGQVMLRALAVAEQDPAFLDAAGRLGQEAHDGQAGHRLAGAGFAHDGQRLAAGQVEGHAVHGFGDAVAAVEPGLQSFHGKHDVSGACGHDYSSLRRRGSRRRAGHRPPAGATARTARWRCREDHDPVGRAHVLLAGVDHGAPGGNVGRHAYARKDSPASARMA